MKIAVYCGSFNPLHKGHEAIMKHLTEKEDFDKVLLIVSPQNPLKEANTTGPARYAAALKALERHQEIHNVEVSDIELGMEPPHYTIRTLETLRQLYPNDSLTLVIGADNLESFPRWRDYRRILKEFGITVYPRKGYHRGHLKARLLKEDPSYRIELLNAPLVTISSTDIRNINSKDMSKWLM